MDNLVTNLNAFAFWVYVVDSREKNSSLRLLVNHFLKAFSVENSDGVSRITDESKK
jgi:hypothetical protein